VKPRSKRLDAAASRAEAQIMNRGPTLNPPIEDSVRGAFNYLTANIGHLPGAWNTGEISFEGTWLIYAANLSALSNEDSEQAQIYIKTVNGVGFQTLVSGEVSKTNGLEWSGHLILRGSWVLRGIRFVAFDSGHNAQINVTCEKLEGVV
jgi:hypothetical protein